MISRAARLAWKLRGDNARGQQKESGYVNMRLEGRRALLQGYLGMHVATCSGP
jgi:hypothetical protein